MAHHSRAIEAIVGHFKAAATRQMSKEGLHPFGDRDERPSPWGAHGWNVFLNSTADVRIRIAYVENNPEKEGKLRQTWGFVTPYEG